MIPKIIHYCWFSEGEKPKKILDCIDSWRKYLPDYEIKCWNYTNFPRGKSKWVDQAVDSKKFAFAADYIRSFALYTEGGIYLDSDVEVLQDLTPLLKYPYFIGRENDGLWEAAVLGTEPGMKLYGKLLEYYQNKEFITKVGLDVTPLPKIMSLIGHREYEVRELNSIDQFDLDSNILQILPFDYFSPKSYKTGELMLTHRTYTIHHFTASWHGNKEKLYKSVALIFGKRFAVLCNKLYKGIKNFLK